MKKVSLVQLREKQSGKVVDIAGGLGLQNKLLGMGIYPGKSVTKLSQFMLRGPVALKVGRSVVALGYGMAHKIIVTIE